MQKNINTPDIKHIIGHNSSIFIKLTIKTLIFLGVLFVLYIGINQYREFEYLTMIFGLLGLFLFAKYAIDFLNLYLDGIALAPEGITLFLWEGLLEYKTEFFERDKIVAINHNQKGLWDKLFKRGDLLINLEQGIEFPFENITSPKKQVDTLLKYKERYDTFDIDEENNPHTNENVAILAEALGEVMKEYMDKKNTSEEEENLY